MLLNCNPLCIGVHNLNETGGQEVQVPSQFIVYLPCLIKFKTKLHKNMQTD